MDSRVARPLWLKLFGPHGPSSIDELRVAIMGTPLGDRIESDSVLQRLFRVFDRPSPAGESRAFVIPDFPLVAPDLDADAQDAQVVVASPPATHVEPQGGAEAGDHGTVSVQVDWPWQVAVGLAPMTADWEALAQHKPSGWVEMLLAQQALESPLLIELGADMLGGGASAPFWADSARSGLGLSGDFSTEFTLAAMPLDIDRITLAAGGDYNLVVTDGFVAAGGSLVVDASAMRPGDQVIFDGSAETDGSFSFVGSQAGDSFIGGSGGDRITGLGGGDTLAGGGGADTFVYTGASESSGANYDTLADFNPGVDRIDLPGNVTGFDATVQGGSLSASSFSHDLAAALGGLGASHAALFTPNAGDLAGTLFLVVDANGVAGYQDGQDYVFALASTPAATIAGHPEIFI
jgi:hypothetical protein